MSSKAGASRSTRRSRWRSARSAAATVPDVSAASRAGRSDQERHLPVAVVHDGRALLFGHGPAGVADREHENTAIVAPVRADDLAWYEHLRTRGELQPFAVFG